MSDDAEVQQMNALRPDLPPLPERMQRLPVDRRGYPVPWFVAWLDEAGHAVPRGKGTPDFRVITPGGIAQAVLQGLCWICGERMGTYLSFLIGPMCAVNRTNSEPPSHLECADFGARACPFLANPSHPRREKNMPPGWIPAAGMPIERNPGVAVVWTTKSYRLLRAGNGVLFELGEPVHTRWYCESRPATRAEVLHSIDTGLPILEAAAREDGLAGLSHLRYMTANALRLLPPEPQP